MTTIEQALNKYKELNELKASAKRLEVGCEVTLANGSKQIISEVRWGEEAIGTNLFFRWDAFFPYEIEHAAMSDSMAIVNVKWD